MKRVWRISAIVSVVLFIAAIFFWTHRPAPPKTDEELKNTLPATATQFIQCIETIPIGSCFFTLTTDAYRASTDIQKMTTISLAIKEKIGDRISGAMDPDSFKIILSSDDPPARTVHFSMNAIYQNDATTRESFIFAYDPRSDQYTVYAFKINSSKF